MGIKGDTLQPAEVRAARGAGENMTPLNGTQAVTFPVGGMFSNGSPLQKNGLEAATASTLQGNIAGGGFNNQTTEKSPIVVGGAGVEGDSYTSMPAVGNYFVLEAFVDPPAPQSIASLSFTSPELQNGITMDSMSSSQGSTSTPPDPHGASGPFSVISVVNFRIQSLNKATGEENWGIPLSDFFAKYKTVFLFDAKIIYDVHSNAFAVVVLDGGCETSNILLAVSNNSDPMNIGDWKFTKFQSFDKDQRRWADYPGFECDEDAYYITANMFLCGTQDFKSKLWIVKKNDFENDQPQGFYLENIGTAQPAEVRDRSGAGQDIGTYLVGDSKDGFTFIQVKNPTGSAIFAYSSVTLVLGTPSNPIPDAAQKGASATQLIDTGNSRVLDAVWHDSTVWFVITRFNNNKATAFWAQIDVSKWPTLSEIQSGVIDLPGVSTFFASISVNNNGITAFGFAGSGSNIYAGAFFTWRRPTDPKGTTREIETVRAGLGSYYRPHGDGRNRWGDYTGISIDPTSENCFWVYNQYAGENSCGDSCTQEAFGSWSTAWAGFCVAAQPSSKPSVMPSIKPSTRPSLRPSAKPSLKPSASPSQSKSQKSARKKKATKKKALPVDFLSADNSTQMSLNLKQLVDTVTLPTLPIKNTTSTSYSSSSTTSAYATSSTTSTYASSSTAVHNVTEVTDLF